jgi:ribokinase
VGNILDIGSINIDYVYEVEHFVRPGETISSRSMSVFPGGKGLNQSVALARAGGRVWHAGRVGRDGLGMIKIMKDAGVNVELVDSSGSATGHAIIQVNASGENCIIIHPGANFELERDFIDNALRSFGEGDFLILQNEVSNMPYIINAASRKGLSIAFNLAPFGPEIKEYPLGLADILLVNEIEGGGVSGRHNTEEILDEMTKLFPSAAVVLTAGRDGAMYRGPGETRTLSHGIYDVPVVDTTAAGDTFTGFFISSVADGKPPAEALRIASIASSIAVSRKGASSSVPTLAETLKANLKYLGA